MSNLEYRSGLFAAACGMLAACLFLLDLATTPRFFENAGPELILLAPLAVWLIARLFAHRTYPHA